MWRFCFTDLVTFSIEEQITDELDIDHRVHSRLIGAKGKAIAKVMENFNVMIRFPKDKTGSVVTVTGLEENVEDAKEHLLLLAEEYMQDVIEKQEEQDLLNQYTRRTAKPLEDTAKGSRTGYVVKGAPWSGSEGDEFPAIGGPANTSKAPTWGPSSLGPKL
uniref:K Homology domain-containing protein n=2 Tax=Amphimedon queenslandica TaxID=400682 RepID=A0A1X7SY17_AMPQE